MKALSSILQKARAYSYYGITGLLSLFFGVIAFKTYQHIVQKKTSILNMDHAIDVMQKNALAAKGLPEDLKQAQSIGTIIDHDLIDPEKKAANIGFFYALENTTHAHIETIVQQKVTPIKTIDKINYLDVPYALTLNGQFHEVLDFLYQLQISSHWLFVHKIDIAQIQADNRGKQAIDAIRCDARISFLGKDFL